MSGGSYDYLCFKTADELINMQDTIQEMADRLFGLDYADDAANETQALLLEIKSYETQSNKVAGKLCKVWRAIEWWDSCDSTESELKTALAKYREQPK